MSEERLRVIGVPLGPRVRILQEASRLRPVAPPRTNSNLGNEGRIKRK